MPNFGWAPYANQAVAQIIARNRQQAADQRMAAIQQAQAGLIGAQTAALTKKSSPDEIVERKIDPVSGKLYNIYGDGSYEEAPSRAARAAALAGPTPGTMPPVGEPIPSANTPSGGPSASPTPAINAPTPPAPVAPTDTTPRFAKPPTIDPNSPAGVSAAVSKAEQIARLQARNKAVSDSTMAANFGPTSPRAITADSIKAENAARAGARYPSNLLTTGTDSAGHPVIVTGKSKGPIDLQVTGVKKPATATASAQLNREKDYVNLIGQGLPVMEQLVDQVRPAAIVAALKSPTVGNVGLNQAEQTFLLNARNALAGVLHQESGARLSDTQLDFGLQRFLPNLGDTPATKRQKLAALRKVYEGRMASINAGQMPTDDTGSGGGTGVHPLDNLDQWLKDHPAKQPGGTGGP